MMGNIQKETKNYLSSEAEYLRNNYESRINKIKDLERYSLFSTGLIWSWCATKEISSEFQIIVWLPALITFLFGIRAWGNSKAMASDIEYLMKIENYLSLPEGYGFGRYIKIKQDIRIKYSSYLFWVALQIITITAPAFILKYIS